MAGRKRGGISPGTIIKVGTCRMSRKGELEDVEILSEQMLGGNGFKWEDGLWIIAFGQKTIRLSHTKGLGYIRYLLERREKRIPASELIEAAHIGQRDLGRATDADKAAVVSEAGLSEATLGDAGPASDHKALREYYERVNDLNVEIAEAERDHNSAEAARLAQQKEDILRQISEDFGLHGRPRIARMTSNRQRNSVAKCINEAIEQVRAKHPDLAAHFDQAIKTGFDCAYCPREDPSWLFDW